MKALPLAFAEYEKKTCLRFKKRTNEASYVQIFHGQGWDYYYTKDIYLSIDLFICLYLSVSIYIYIYIYM